VDQSSDPQLVHLLVFRWDLGAVADQAGLAAAGIAAPSDLQEIFDGCC